MRRILAAIDARDVFGLLGLGAIAVGLGMVSLPAALVVTGSILLAMAVWPSVAILFTRRD